MAAHHEATLRPLIYNQESKMKVDKAKFDDLLGKLIKAKPLPKKKVKAAKKRSPKPIIQHSPQKG
jgi:hypothetical protein